MQQDEVDGELPEVVKLSDKEVEREREKMGTSIPNRFFIGKHGFTRGAQGVGPCSKELRDKGILRNAGRGWPKTCAERRR